MRREATIYAGRPIQASAVAEPQHNGYRRSSIDATASRSDTNHMRRRGAKSFVDDLVLSRGVVLSRAELFCDLLRLSLMTRRFVRFRRTYLLLLRLAPAMDGRWRSLVCLPGAVCRTGEVLSFLHKFYAGLYWRPARHPHLPAVESLQRPAASVRDFAIYGRMPYSLRLCRF